MKNSNNTHRLQRALTSERKQPGFSLIVTITMMVLLSLIAVGLLSLSSTTLRASNSLNAQLEARANAKLALTLAIAQLQQELGPDQRVTAVANIAGNAEGDSLAVGADPENNSSLDSTNKGLTSVQPGTRYWTGVFENNDDPDQIFSKTPSASHRSWLVSGFDPAVPQNSITPANELYAANVDGSPVDGESGIVLVGRNSFGNASAGADNYVVAPIVNVSEGDEIKGSLAWWIGDENVKAVVNSSIGAVSADEESLATLAPQRLGWEIVEGMEDYPSPTSGDQESLARIYTLETTGLVLDQNISSLTDDESLYHSATVAGRGLHVNVSEGGLKVDLTTALANNLPSSSSDFDNYPASGNPIIRPLATDESLGLLTWDRLTPFYDKVTNTDSSDPLEVGVDFIPGGSSTNVGSYVIAPIVVDMRLLLGARVASRRRVITANPCAKIAIVIANPYSRTLEWSDDLEFQFRSLLGLNGNHSARIWNLRDETAYFPSDERVDSLFGSRKNGAEQAVFNQAVFQIAPDSLEPGEARVYTIAEPISRVNTAATSRIDVPLVADANSLGDFNSCLEMEVPTPTRTLPQTLDVREVNNTATIQLEMRLGGTSLRRLSGIELNNPDFSATERRWTEAIPEPIPLQLYRFQLSQPGVNYADKFRGTPLLGERASALRTFADFNLQANHFDVPITSYTPPPYFFQNSDSPSDIGGSDLSLAAGKSGDAFGEGLFEDPVLWGYSDTEGSAQTVLYSIPDALSSIAQLQHVDLTVDATKVSIAHQPAYAVGNSYATPFVKRAMVEEERHDYVVTSFGGSRNVVRNYYDVSYLLNASLWDRYFFSTWDSSRNSFLNPNQVSLSDVDLGSVEPTAVAASVVNSKMFNVNSTSISAWKALLASSKDHISIGGSDNKITFPRSLQQPTDAIDNPSGSDEDSWSGNRVLSDDEVDLLAREIVRQVRLRGPFVSMAQFVNRSLAEGSQEPEQTRSGPLQFALDESGVNMDIEGNNAPFTDLVPEENRAGFAFDRSAPRAERAGGSSARKPVNVGPNVDWASTSTDDNYKSLSSIVANRDFVGARNPLADEFGYRSTSMPAWVNQADVLQLLGPSMSVRSDSFTIRTCGRSHDASGRVIAVAYAEALVQRSSEFVDSSNSATDNLDALSDTNQRFGRRFEMVSFRWLSENEI